MAKSHRLRLKDFHRAFLVREFACFSTPMEAADALKQEFGIEISPQGAQHYDVKSVGGKKAAKKWHELTEFAREAFLDDVKARIPESYKSVRIQELARASRIFKKRSNYLAMANMLERIAKEMGNIHTNRYEFTGKDRGPIKFAAIDDMTDDQIDQELRRIFKVGDGARVQPPPESEQ